MPAGHETHRANAPTLDLMNAFGKPEAFLVRRESEMLARGVPSPAARARQAAPRNGSWALDHPGEHPHGFGKRAIAPDVASLPPLDITGALPERLHGIDEVEREAVHHGSFCGNLAGNLTSCLTPSCYSKKTRRISDLNMRKHNILCSTGD